MSVSMEAHRDKFAPQEWQRLLKMSAVYAQSFEVRVCGEEEDRAKAGGEEVLRLTLSRIAEGQEGYTFRDSDILFFHYLCRCCRRTVLALHNAKTADVAAEQQPAEIDDTPVELTERAALAFLERRQGSASFQAFVKEKKLRGKLRAYCAGLAKYAADGDPERIARDLRTTVETLSEYRSRLRELLEDFESERVRRRLA
jgi:hypothetical protein